MRLRHARHHIELHQLSQRRGPALLFLHQMFGSSADGEPLTAAWEGSVYALDFPGHGRSEWLPGGAYYPEYFAASADIALQQIGTAVVAGAGVGAYVALLLAGGRPDLIPAALLLPGVGLAGGGVAPDPSQPLPDFATWSRIKTNGSDPLVTGMEMFPRPPDFTQRFAAAARRVLLAEDGSARPPWWEEARTSPSAVAVSGSVGEMLAVLAAHGDHDAAG